MISLSCRQIVFNENANFWKRCNNNHKLFKLSWNADCRFPPVFTVFNRFRVDGWKRYDNDTKTTCRRSTIVAFSLKMYSCRWGPKLNGPLLAIVYYYDVHLQSDNTSLRIMLMSVFSQVVIRLLGGHFGKNCWSMWKLHVFHLLLVTRCSLNFYSLLVAFYSLFVAFYSLLAAFYLLLVAFLLVTHWVCTRYLLRFFLLTRCSVTCYSLRFYLSWNFSW